MARRSCIYSLTLSMLFFLKIQSNINMQTLSVIDSEIAKYAVLLRKTLIFLWKHIKRRNTPCMHSCILTLKDFTTQWITVVACASLQNHKEKEHANFCVMKAKHGWKLQFSVCKTHTIVRQYFFFMMRWFRVGTDMGKSMKLSPALQGYSRWAIISSLFKDSV